MKNQTAVTVFALLERILALSSVRFIVPHVEYHGTGLSTSYGDWDELRSTSEVIPERCYVMPELCSGSDYSGSLVERANYQALLDDMPQGYEDGVEYITYSGGHGTYALAIRFDALSDDLLETLESLDDYPLISEDVHSHLEMESQDEAWSNGLRSDFKTALGSALASVYESTHEEPDDDALEFLSDDCGEISDENIDRLFYLMADFGNVYWVNESGSDSYIDVDDVVKRGLDAKRLNTEWRKSAYAEIKSLIQSSMSDRKYDLGIMRYIDPDQLTLPLLAVSHE
jgi:hypothetical protein